MQYNVSLLDARIKDILEDRISYSFFLMQRSATFISYVGLAKGLFKFEQSLSLEQVDQETETGNGLEISHLDRHMLYSAWRRHTDD